MFAFASKAPFCACIGVSESVNQDRYLLNEVKNVSFGGGAKNAAELAIFVSQLAIFAVT